jgi:hypothetical protein
MMSYVGRRVLVSYEIRPPHENGRSASLASYRNITVQKKVICCR